MRGILVVLVALVGSVQGKDFPSIRARMMKGVTSTEPSSVPSMAPTWTHSMTEPPIFSSNDSPSFSHTTDFGVLTDSPSASPSSIDANTLPPTDRSDASNLSPLVDESVNLLPEESSNISTTLSIVGAAAGAVGITFMLCYIIPRRSRKDTRGDGLGKMMSVADINITCDQTTGSSNETAVEEELRKDIANIEDAMHRYRI